MEPEIKSFLIRIVRSIFAGLFWMCINLYFGIKKGLLFLENPINIWHYVFYAWLIGSFIFLIFLMKKIWKDAPDFTQEDVERNKRFHQEE